MTKSIRVNCLIRKDTKLNRAYLFSYHWLFMIDKIDIFLEQIPRLKKNSKNSAKYSSAQNQSRICMIFAL